MKKSVKSFGLCLIASITFCVSANAQITLISLKKLSSDDQSFQTEFLPKNGYQFTRSLISKDEQTMYIYNKYLNNNAYKSIGFIKGKKFVIWSTDDEGTFNTQKSKLLNGDEKYTRSTEDEFKKRFPCSEETYDFGVEGESDYGLPSIWLFSSGFLMSTLEGIVNDKRVYNIILLNPSFCGD